jgi:hypothetical protein
MKRSFVLLWRSFVSIAAPTVLRMQDQDFVDPGDAAPQELLASAAEPTRDPARRDRLLNFLLTMPPLVEWSAEELEMLTETCAYIRSLARLGRELEVLNGD